MSSCLLLQRFFSGFSFFPVFPGSRFSCVYSSSWVHCCVTCHCFHCVSWYFPGVAAPPGLGLPYSPGSSLPRGGRGVMFPAPMIGGAGRGRPSHALRSSMDGGRGVVGVARDQLFARAAPVTRWRATPTFPPARVSCFPSLVCGWCVGMAHLSASQSSVHLRRPNTGKCVAVTGMSRIPVRERRL